VRWRSEEDGGIPAAGVPELVGEVARKLPRDDVVRMVALVEVGVEQDVGTTVAGWWRREGHRRGSGCRRISPAGWLIAPA
jgi:hypothetical protein